MRDFHPDFIFWLVKGNKYTILYIDPKGMTASNYQYKIDGYKELFCEKESGNQRKFKFGDYEVNVALGMYTTDANQSPQEYKEYWYDTPKSILKRIG
jgi:hypothetical protein